MDLDGLRLAVRRSTAAKMLDCGATKIWELQKAGKLETIKIGADDRITVESIKALIQRRLTAGKNAEYLLTTPCLAASSTPKGSRDAGTVYHVFTAGRREILRA